MTKKILTIFFLITFFLFSNCNKNKIEFADENIKVNNEPPGLAIYKTNSDYFDYVTILLDSNNNIVMTPAYNSNDTRITFDENGKVIYKLRWRLKSGYIVCKEMSFERIFTNITFQELIEYVDENGNDIPDIWFEQRIIDKNPFIEFYYLQGEFPAQEFTLGDINKMIEEETLETIFTKIK